MLSRLSLVPLLIATLLFCSTVRAQGEGDSPEPAPAPKSEPAPSAADDDEPAPVTKAQKEKARFHFRKGIKLLNEEAWGPALAEFLESIKNYPTPVATGNAAVSLRKLQRYDEALDMYETYLRDFKVKPGKRATALKEIAELRGLVGTIDIVGAEPGAIIVVSSIDRGEYPPVTPLRVPAGSHFVRVQKEGFESYETTVDVAGGKIVSIQAKMPKLTNSGTLIVKERNGKKTEVLVDNVARGTTPWEGILSVGDHSVVLRGAGRVGSQPATATVKSEGVTTLTLFAEDLNSQLRIDPTPVGAMVSIDGVDVGSGVWLGRLKAGPHKIEGRKDGFLTFERTLNLASGKREAIKLALERDEDAPMWRKPSRWMFDVSGGLVVMPGLGGDLGDSCSGDCSAGIGLGALTVAHAGYELGSGLGFGLELGYVLTSQTYENRPTNLTPNGLTDANTGTVTDDLRMQGFIAGLALGYHLGDSFPVVLRLGAGVMIGEVRDERIGDFAAVDGNAYRTTAVADFQSATYFYLDPTIRAGVPLGENWELSASVQALMLIALSQPKFNNTIELGASTDGIGTYGNESLMGAFVIGIVPGASIRYHFK